VIATGIRRGELLGLRWRDVDLVEGFISISQTRITDGTSMKIGTPKTRAGRRTIAIDNGTVTALWHLKTLHNTAAEMLGMPLSDLVAADVDGKPISRHTLWIDFTPLLSALD
jgi:integrase